MNVGHHHQIEPIRPAANVSRVRWLYIFAFWTFLGLFFAVQMIISYISRGNEADWTAALVFQMSRWYSWGLLTPLLIALARPFGFDRNWRRNLGIHFIASLIFAPLQVMLALVLRNGAFLILGTLSMEQVSSYLTNVPIQILTGSFDSFIVYWLILGIYYTVVYYQRLQERQLYASKLESQLATAQLTALKMQLHPHFLFNTLHGITALIPTDPAAAETMIARLSDLLRLTLENEGTQLVSLKQEMEFLQHYLDIEQTRFQDRLTVNIRIESDTLDCRIPNLILQPLVENAIRHGTAPLRGPGFIHIRSYRNDGTLTIQISDNGPGIDLDVGIAEGVGISNTRRRLTQLYGDSFVLHFATNANGGTNVTLKIPTAHSIIGTP